jgi:hypothetical protein
MNKTENIMTLHQGSSQKQHTTNNKVNSTASAKLFALTYGHASSDWLPAFWWASKMKEALINQHAARQHQCPLGQAQKAATNKIWTWDVLGISRNYTRLMPARLKCAHSRLRVVTHVLSREQSEATRDSPAFIRHALPQSCGPSQGTSLSNTTAAHH